MIVGGSQLNAIELAASVRDRGHEVTVFGEDGPMAAHVEQRGLPLVVAPPGSRRPSAAVAGALRDLCHRERIDVVHGYEWPPCLEAFFGPRLRDGVVTGCTIMSMAVAPFVPSSVPLVVGTEQIAASVRARRRGPTDVIEPPVDTDDNHPGIDGSEFRRRHELGAGPVAVLVSRLATELKLEGLRRSIGAAGRLAAESGLQLVIVGDGPARAELERRAGAVNRSAGRRVVTLTGELLDPRPAYAAGDVLLGMGGSALRAMAFAKPVVVLGEQGFAEVLAPETADTFLWQGFYGLGDGDSGPEPLAALLRPLLADEARRRALGAFARRLVDSRFSLAAAAARQEHLYEQWRSVGVSRPAAVRDALGSALRLADYKVRRRIDRYRRREANEDFNTTTTISRTAELAGRPD
jgi:glycosyltransferase involved in cell wall biosynthesis